MPYYALYDWYMLMAATADLISLFVSRTGKFMR
jgi:hypothetical protein